MTNNTTVLLIRAEKKLEKIQHKIKGDRLSRMLEMGEAYGPGSAPASDYALAYHRGTMAAYDRVLNWIEES